MQKKIKLVTYLFAAFFVIYALLSTIALTGIEDNYASDYEQLLLSVNEFNESMGVSGTPDDSIAEYDDSLLFHNATDAILYAYRDLMQEPTYEIAGNSLVDMSWKEYLVKMDLKSKMIEYPDNTSYFEYIRMQRPSNIDEYIQINAARKQYFVNNIRYQIDCRNIYKLDNELYATWCADYFYPYVNPYTTDTYFYTITKAAIKQEITFEPLYNQKTKALTGYYVGVKLDPILATSSYRRMLVEQTENNTAVFDSVAFYCTLNTKGELISFTTLEHYHFKKNIAWIINLSIAARQTNMYTVSRTPSVKHPVFQNGVYVLPA